MKTSLNISNHLFKAAQRQAQKEEKTLSEVISYWAQLGRTFLAQQKKKGGRKLTPVDLGGMAAVNVNSRRDWIDALDKDSEL